MLKIMLWIVGSIIVVALGLYKGCMNSKIEHSSRHTVAWSSDLAREGGKLVKKVQANPGFIVVNNKQIPIEEAWIERACQVQYTLLFFGSTTCYDEYKLVFRLRNSQILDPNTVHVVSSENGFGTQSSGIGQPFVIFESLGNEYPQSLTANVLDSAKQPVGSLTFVAL